MIPVREEYVSDEFLTAVQENTLTYYWSGTITTTVGKVYETVPMGIYEVADGAFLVLDYEVGTD